MFIDKLDGKNKQKFVKYALQKSAEKNGFYGEIERSLHFDEETITKIYDAMLNQFYAMREVRNLQEKLESLGIYVGYWTQELAPGESHHNRYKTCFAVSLHDCGWEIIPIARANVDLSSDQMMFIDELNYKMKNMIKGPIKDSTNVYDDEYMKHLKACLPKEEQEFFQKYVIDVYGKDRPDAE